MSEITPHIYSIDEIPKFDIDYRGLINYARSKGCTVPELTDDEKELFMHGRTMDDLKLKSLK